MSYSGTACRVLVLGIALALLAPAIPVMGAEHPKSKLFDTLIAYAGSSSAEEPLLAFSDFSVGDGHNIRSANRRYLMNDQDLISRIRSDLGGKPVSWRLQKITQRLMFVPETRIGYRELFETYCRDAVRFVLKETGLADPYSSIETLESEKPELPNDHRIKAFLVNNVAREFIATNLFATPEDRKLKIDIHGRVFIGEIGFFKSELVRGPDGSLRFERDRYTIWQNNAANPYSALMTPIEETLHISMRTHTESAVLDTVRRDGIDRFEEIRPVAMHWLAVEEALIGGVVQAILPLYFEQWTDSFSPNLIEADLKTKARFDKYRYLQAGIKLVERLGARQALKKYSEAPAEIEKMMM